MLTRRAMLGYRHWLPSTYLPDLSLLTFRLDFFVKGGVGMVLSNEHTKLIRKLHFRRNQARRIAGAAETCAVEDCPDRTLRLLEEVEDFVHDAWTCHGLVPCP